MKLGKCCLQRELENSRMECSELPKSMPREFLDNRNVFSHSSGGQKSKLKVLAGLDFSEASLLGLWMAVICLCPHMAPLCVSVSSSLLLRRTPATGLRFIHVTSF